MIAQDDQSQEQTLGTFSNNYFRFSFQAAPRNNCAAVLINGHNLVVQLLPLMVTSTKDQAVELRAGVLAASMFLPMV